MHPLKTVLVPIALWSGLSTTPFVFAAGDPFYPAADFTPSVIYRDPGLLYPAADFTPSVIYRDPELIERTSRGTESKYPASDFQPRVIYRDEGYIATQRKESG
jgi:hypothetical protein